MPERPVLLEHSPRRPRVPVERHPDTAGVDELRARHRTSPEGQVRVTENYGVLLGTREPLDLLRVRVGHEGDDVGERRAVAVAPPLYECLGGQRGKLADE